MCSWTSTAACGSATTPRPAQSRRSPRCARPARASSFVTNDARHSRRGFRAASSGASGFRASVEEVVTVGGGAAVPARLDAGLAARPSSSAPRRSTATSRPAGRARDRLATRRRRRDRRRTTSSTTPSCATPCRRSSTARRRCARARDATFPMPDGPWPGTGAVVAALETATGIEAITVGKPVARDLPHGAGPARPRPRARGRRPRRRRPGRGAAPPASTARSSHGAASGCGAPTPPIARRATTPRLDLGRVPRDSSPHRQPVRRRRPRRQGPARGAGATARARRRASARELTRDLPHAQELARARRRGRRAGGGAAAATGSSARSRTRCAASRTRVMGVLPGGRGNDFARVRRDPARRRGGVRRDRRRRAARRSTSATSTERTFIGIASLGFDSEANRIANEAPPRSAASSTPTGRCGRSAAWKHAAFEVVVDGEARAFSGWSVAVRELEGLRRRHVHGARTPT